LSSPRPLPVAIVAAMAATTIATVAAEISQIIIVHP
jgi:hypothetical protein